MRSWAKQTLALSVIMLHTLCLAQPSLAQGAGEQEAVDLPSLISELISQPIVLASFIVKFCLGLMLGYFSVRALKYVLALAGVIAVGLILDVWQLGGLEEFVSRIGLDWVKVYSLFKTLLSAFGILTILPVGLGFFIGFVAAARR